MNFSKTVLLFSMAAILFTACKNNVDFKKTSAGVPYKVFSGDKGDSIKPNFYVKYEVIQRVGDSVMYSSYRMKRAEYVQVQPVFGELNYMDIRNNVMEILPKAKKGDSLYIVQAVDSLLKRDSTAGQNGLFKKGGEIITTVRIVEVFKTAEEAQAYLTKENAAGATAREKDALQSFKSDATVQQQLKSDNKTIEDYLVTKNIPTQKTEWGTYIQILNPGEGPKPSFGKWVTVKYVGTHFDGTEFDKGTYPYQLGNQGPIRGFDDGVRQLGKGGKAKIFIPSVLAYGPQGNGEKIKPNESIAFEIELLDISDTQPAPSEVPVNPAQRR